MGELAFQDHLSVSQVHEFLDCGEYYRNHRVVGHIPPTGIGAIAGKSYHRALECLFVENAHLFPDLEASLVNPNVLGAKGEYDAVWSMNPPAKLMPVPEMDEYEEKARVMWPLAQAAFDKYRTILKPKMLEAEFITDIAGSPVKGYMDMVTSDGIVLDWKTGVRAPSENAALRSPQLTAYDWAYRKLFGKPPKKLGIIWATMRKVKGSGMLTPEFREFWSDPRTDDDFERLQARFGLLKQTLENDGPWLPAQEGHWLCSKERCIYWEGCKVRP